MPSYEHPSLSLLVTDAQRDRAVDYLQNAFADGRLSAEELDQRLGQALEARTRRELNAAFSGLVRVPAASQALGAHPAYRPLINQHQDGTSGRVVAGVAHWSSIPFPLVGPGVAYAVSEKGSFARSQAAKAFNFQLAAIGIAIMLGIVSGITDVGFLSGIWALTWFVITVIGGVKAFSGESWTNPVMRFIPWRPLDETERRAIGH